MTEKTPIERTTLVLDALAERVYHSCIKLGSFSGEEDEDLSSVFLSLYSKITIAHSQVQEGLSTDEVLIELLLECLALLRLRSGEPPGKKILERVVSLAQEAATAEAAVKFIMEAGDDTSAAEASSEDQQRRPLHVPEEK